jgi:hypothetical protein
VLTDDQLRHIGATAHNCGLGIRDADEMLVAGRRFVAELNDDIVIVPIATAEQREAQAWRLRDLYEDFRVQFGNDDRAVWLAILDALAGK